VALFRCRCQSTAGGSHAEKACTVLPNTEIETEALGIKPAFFLFVELYAHCTLLGTRMILDISDISLLLWDSG
jgi:hypothetical protein